MTFYVNYKKELIQYIILIQDIPTFWSSSLESPGFWNFCPISEIAWVAHSKSHSMYLSYNGETPTQFKPPQFSIFGQFSICRLYPLPPTVMGLESKDVEFSRFENAHLNAHVKNLKMDFRC